MPQDACACILLFFICPELLVRGVSVGFLELPTAEAVGTYFSDGEENCIKTGIGSLLFCLLIHFPFESLLPGKQQSPFWSLPQHSQSNFTKIVLLGQVVVSLTFPSTVFLVIHSCTHRFVAHTHSLVPRTSTIMKIIFYLAAMLAIVGAAVATQDSCWCKPTYEGEPSRKSPECCY